MSLSRHAPAQLLGGLTPAEEKAAPSVLYILGDVDVVRRSPRVSIVGSRAATPRGLQLGEMVARALVELDTTVVSGLAAGIDRAAHVAAIKAGGRTFAVIGTPPEQASPRANERLQQYIAEHFAVVSQFAPGSRVYPGNFPARNKTMALLTDATVIIEAAEKSGTRHQGWEAIRLGRALFLSEDVARDPRLTWPAKMLQYGAIVLREDEMLSQLSEVTPVSAVGDVAF